MAEKACVKCEQMKSVTEFHHRKDKYTSTCKICRKDDTKKRYELKLREHPPREKINDNTQVEVDAIKFLSSILSSIYEVRRVNEWCLADICIRLRESTDDEWTMIQVKATRGKGPIGYQFPLKKAYPDCIVLLVSLEDNKIWNICNKISASSITIGPTRSKYDKFLIKENELINTILKCDHNKFSLNEINIPINVNHKLESEYAKIRLKLPYEFIYPHREGLKYDFLLYNMLVQEKVGRRDPTSCSYRFHVTAGNNKKYRPGEVDLFWFHFPDKTHFAVIPFSQLHDRGILDQTSYNLNFKKDNWYSKYINDYDCFPSLHNLVEHHMPNRISYNEIRASMND